jgi:hypothetical protein
MKSVVKSTKAGLYSLSRITSEYSLTRDAYYKFTAKQHNRGNAPAAGTLNHQPPKHCFTKSSSICSRRSTLSTLFPPIKKA